MRIFDTTVQLLKRTVRDHFLEYFRTSPIMVFSPGRINLIGEHTDYNKGYVLPAAIDMGIVMAIQKSMEPLCTATAIDISETFSFELGQLSPIPKGGWQNYIMGVISEIQKKGIKTPPFNVVFGGSIPPGAGLSSSAALENALVFSLNELFQLGFSKMEMILISQAAENNFAGVQCGIMDQYASMFGQKDAALFLDCNSLQSEVIPIQNDEFTLLLLDTKVKHSLADTAYNERRDVCYKVAQQLGLASLRDLDLQTLLENSGQFSENTFQKALFVLEENARVLDAVTALRNNDLRAFGTLLFKSHTGLQHQYKVSCEELDFLVDMARDSEDVLGARMMGGGFGGCTLNLVKKNKVDSFVKLVIEKYTTRFNHSIASYQVSLAEGTRLIP
ncbi:galactokinase [uncultured Muriicola sp.]|uniref:galactokinase n=1 Tax=uncultured Muriicola sp. TaxID=1583102 RepID=UPI002633C8F6|nr:galactokinase [uncultured Muriicola sp.]